MAVKEKSRFNRLVPNEFIGLSSDTKPTMSIQYPEDDVLPFAQYIEVDGNGSIVDVWVYDGTTWNH